MPTLFAAVIGPRRIIGAISAAPAQALRRRAGSG
jgi:hypothetical protein